MHGVICFLHALHDKSYITISRIAGSKHKSFHRLGDTLLPGYVALAVIAGLPVFNCSLVFASFCHDTIWQNLLSRVAISSLCAILKIAERRRDKIFDNNVSRLESK